MPSQFNEDEALAEALLKEYGPKEAPRQLALLAGYVDVPPTITEFIDQDYFAGSFFGPKLYPAWRSVLQDIFPDPFYSPYITIAMTGSTRYGKTTACLTYDTKVDLLDGRSVAIGELANETQGQPFWVLALDIQANKWTPALAHSCRKTGDLQPVYEIELDNGERLRATADHRFLTRDNKWIRVDQLIVGTSLKHYHKLANKNRYEYIHTGRKLQSIHSLVAQWKAGSYPHTHVVHHKNFDPRDNRPPNLAIVDRDHHHSYHSKLWKRDGYRARRVEGLQLFWLLNPEHTEKLRKASMVLRNDPKFREKHLAGIRAFHNDRDRREAWLNKLRKPNPKLSAVLKARYSDPAKRERLSIVRRFSLTPESRERLSRAQKRRFENDPSERSRTAARLNTPEAQEKAAAQARTPEAREARSIARRELWISDRERLLEGQRTPALRAQRSETAQRRNSEYWSNPRNRESMSLRSRRNALLKLLNRILLDEVHVDSSNYLDVLRQYRKRKLIVDDLNDTINQGFEGSTFDERLQAALDEAKHYNHRVVSVSFAGYEDVYCMTVPRFHNFPLSAGIVSHNCLAGLLYDLVKLLYIKDPFEQFGIIRTTAIVVAFINTTKTLSQSVLWRQFREMIELSPFFNDKRIGLPKNQFLPNNITPVNGSQSEHYLGTGVVSAILSEINFQKRLRDQAVNNFNQIRIRMAETYGRGDAYITPGRLWMDSSKTDEHGFMETQLEPLLGDPTALVVEKALWEVLGTSGKKEYCGETFKVFIGDDHRDPFILDGPGSALGIPEALIIDVPIEYLKNFQANIYIALRDLAGKSTWSAHKVFPNKTIVSNALQHDNPVTKEVIDLDFHDSSRLIDYLEKEKLERKALYFIHLDVGIRHDRSGLAGTKIIGSKTVERIDRDTGLSLISEEFIYQTDFVMPVVARPGKEVPFFKLKEFFVDFRNLGFRLGGASVDGHQSWNMQQDLNRMGVSTEQISTDRPRGVYDAWTDAVKEGRWFGPKHPILEKEMNALLDKGDKIDHPLNNTKLGQVDIDRPSKDLTDGCAGSHWNCKEKGTVGLRNMTALESFVQYAALRPARRRTIHDQIQDQWMRIQRSSNEF